MKTFNYTITDEVGIHARPAGLLVNAAKEFSSEVTIESDGKSANVKRMMQLLTLGIGKGAEVTFTIVGEDEEQAAASLEKFMQENL